MLHVVLLAVAWTVLSGHLGGPERWQVGLLALAVALVWGRLAASACERAHVSSGRRARALLAGAITAGLAGALMHAGLELVDVGPYPELRCASLARLPYEVAAVVLLGAAVLAGPEGALRELLGCPRTAPIAMANLVVVPWALAWWTLSTAVTHVGRGYGLGWGRLLLLGAVFGAAASLALGRAGAGPPAEGRDPRGLTLGPLPVALPAGVVAVALMLVLGLDGGPGAALLMLAALHLLAPPASDRARAASALVVGLQVALAVGWLTSDLAPRALLRAIEGSLEGTTPLASPRVALACTAGLACAVASAVLAALRASLDVQSDATASR